MKVTIKSRWSSRIVFECDIEAGEDTPLGIRIGMAVKVAVGSGADLRGADLSGAVLSNAYLRGADLRGADWIPRIENIHQKVFAAASADGALDMEYWHRDGYCGTTHCRAGWVCVLSGEGGKVLDSVYGTAAAAAMIYQASDPDLEKIPSWYLGNTEALADMHRLAEAEAALKTA